MVLDLGDEDGGVNMFREEGLGFSGVRVYRLSNWG